MAIFGKSKKEEVTKDVVASDTPASTPAVKPDAKKPASASSGFAINVILSPRVTEKAAILSDSAVYVFKVTPRATKPQVAKAIKEMFKVVPMKVNIVNVKGTRVTTRATGKKGKTDRIKKAYVYLKKGDKIELA